MILFLLLGNVLKNNWEILTGDLVYRKDLAQDWIAGKAIIDGQDPYQTLPELKKQYLPEAKENIFPHPTPHTPLALTLMLVLSMLPYRIAATLWFIAEIGFVIIAVVLLCKTFIRSTGLLLALACCITLVARPIQLSLILGQQSTLVLLVTVLFFLAMKMNKPFVGGVCLGFVLALKAFGVPVVIYMLLKKRWQALGSTVLSFVVLTLLSIAILGWNAVAKYYTEVVPAVSLLYMPDEHNQSLWTIGQRVFGGLYPVIQASTVRVLPIINQPKLIEPATPMFVILALGIVVWQATKSNVSYLSLCSMLVFSTVFSPVAWLHGESVIVLAVFVAYSALSRLHFPAKETWWIVLLIFLFFIGDLLRIYLIGAELTVGTLKSLLTYLPMLTVICWTFFLLNLGRKLEMSQ